MHLLENYRTRYGSYDNHHACGIMRAILVRSLTEDVTVFLPTIQVPVAMLWGQLDEATPFQGAQIMQQLLPRAQLVALATAHHDLMEECPEQVVKLVKQVLMVDHND